MIERLNLIDRSNYSLKGFSSKELEIKYNEKNKLTTYIKPRKTTTLTKYKIHLVSIFFIKLSTKTNRIEAGMLMTNANCVMILKIDFSVTASKEGAKKNKK